MPQLLRRALALTPLLLGMAACEPAYPPIADVGHDSDFKYLIATRYGQGTPAAALRAELAGEGFVFTAGEARGFRFSATRGETDLPCFSYVRVDWNEDDRGRISLIQASRLQCR